MNIKTLILLLYHCNLETNPKIENDDIIHFIVSLITCF
jgi:hypothetical protein